MPGRNGDDRLWRRDQRWQRGRGARRPAAGGESVTAIGSEIFNGNSWNVKAYAICGNALPGLQIVSASSADTSTNKNVTVLCPAGTEVLTAAGEITGGFGRVLLDDLFAEVAAVTATGKETGNGTGNVWRVRAIAVCATP